MKEKPQTILDFRIRIFLLLMKTFKALKLFQVQKTVRKIRANKETDKLPKLEKKLILYKSISAKDCRNLAYHTIHNQFKLDAKSQNEYFSKQVTDMEIGYLDRNVQIAQFLESIKNSKKYLLTVEKCNELLEFVEKKKGKTRQKRVIKKQRFVLKKQNKLPTQVIQGPKPETPQTPGSKVQQRPPKKSIWAQKNIPKVQAPEPMKKDIKPVEKPDFSFKTLHPSWQAMIEQKQMIGNMQIFTGKKIKLN